MASRRTLLNRLLTRPYYQWALPILRRNNLARPSAYDWAAYYLQRAGLRVQGIADVGAYDGTIALHLAHLFPNAQIAAFEPAPDSFRQLQVNVRSCSRIRAYPFAISDRNGQAVLNINRSPQTNSLLTVAQSPEMDAVLGEGAAMLEQVTCETRRLDDFCAEHPELRFDLLKTDTQGLELDVLHGAERTLRDSVRAVIAEFRFFADAYEGDSGRLETLDSYLAGLGFQLVSIPSISPNPSTRRAFEADGVWLRGH